MVRAMKNVPVREITRLLRGKQTGSALLLAAITALAVWYDWQAMPPDPHAAARGRYEGVCVKVLDGDTLDVRAESGEEFRLRLLGVDSMETHQEDKLAEQARRLGRSGADIRWLGEQARERTRALVLSKRIAWDVPEGTPLFDPYDRLLAYVEIDGRDLGEILLREGLAETRRDPHPRARAYRAAAAPLAFSPP